MGIRCASSRSDLYPTVHRMEGGVARLKPPKYTRLVLTMKLLVLTMKLLVYCIWMCKTSIKKRVKKQFCLMSVILWF